jgi:hypothetical protein
VNSWIIKIFLFTSANITEPRIAHELNQLPVESRVIQVSNVSEADRTSTFYHLLSCQNKKTVCVFVTADSYAAGRAVRGGSITWVQHVEGYEETTIRIIAHEVGHALGLSHSDDCSNMSADIWACENWREARFYDWQIKRILTFMRRKQHV